VSKSGSECDYVRRHGLCVMELEETVCMCVCEKRDAVQ
jgi:hypothetical protein